MTNEEMAKEVQAAFEALIPEVLDPKTRELSDKIVKLMENQRNGILLGSMAMIVSFILSGRGEDNNKIETAAFATLVLHLCAIDRTVKTISPGFIALRKSGPESAN